MHDNHDIDSITVLPIFDIDYIRYKPCSILPNPNVYSMLMYACVMCSYS